MPETLLTLSQIKTNNNKKLSASETIAIIVLMGIDNLTLISIHVGFDAEGDWQLYSMKLIKYT